MQFKDETERGIWAATYANRYQFYTGDMPIGSAALQSVCEAAEAVLRYRQTVNEWGDDDDGIVPHGVCAREHDAHRAAQILISEIGAPGPESIVDTATRAAEYMRNLRSAALPEYLPSVEIIVSGDVGRAESEDGDWPHWRVYAEADADDSIRVHVSLDHEALADVRVCDTSEGHVGLWDEAQDIAAAILWSGLRAWHLSRIKGVGDV